MSLFTSCHTCPPYFFDLFVLIEPLKFNEQTHNKLEVFYFAKIEIAGVVESSQRI